VEGGSGANLNGLYSFLEEDNLLTQTCVDNCVYVKDGEKYCFQRTPGTTLEVSCVAAPPSTIPTTKTEKTTTTAATTTMSTTTPATTTITTTSAPTPSYILVIGGLYSSMESWTPLDYTPPTYNRFLVKSLSGSRAANLGGQIYSCGGGNPNSDLIEQCYTTVPGQQDWTRAPDLQVGRYDHTLTAVGDKLVATGGSSSTSILDSVEILNPGSSSWTDAGFSLSEAVMTHCAVADSNSSLVIIGGSTTDGSSNRVRRYDLNTKAVTSLPDFPTTIANPACVMYNNKITVSGGFDGTVKSMKMLQLLEGQWVENPSMNIARQGHNMVVMDGQLYVIGGMGGEKSVEMIYKKPWWETQTKVLSGLHMFGGAVAVN